MVSLCSCTPVHTDDLTAECTEEGECVVRVAALPPARLRAGNSAAQSEQLSVRKRELESERDWFNQADVNMRIFIHSVGTNMYWSYETLAHERTANQIKHLRLHSV